MKKVDGEEFDSIKVFLKTPILDDDKTIVYKQKKNKNHVLFSEYMQLDNIVSFSPGSMLPCITSEKRRISKRNNTGVFKTIFLARGF